MIYASGIILVLHYAVFTSIASPAGRPDLARRAAYPHITAAPALYYAHENELMPRQEDPCTVQCAVCALYAPCETCTISLSTPAGIECCTSKLANEAACPSNNGAKTAATYTLGSLTFSGNPTSLVIGSSTLTAGGVAVTVSGHTLSIPTTATDGGIVQDGTTTSLGAPIATAGPGTGEAASSVEGQTVISATVSGSVSFIHHASP